MAGVTGTIWAHTNNKLFAEPPAIIVDFQDGEIARSVAAGIIKPLGVLPAGAAANAGSQREYYGKAAASSFPGTYRQLSLVSGIGFLSPVTAVAQLGETILIEEFATEQGDLDGVVINAISDTDWSVDAKRSGTPPFTSDATIVLEFRHRDGGSESTIATDETGVLTASQFTYAGTVNFTQSFGTDEQLVLKLYIKQIIPP